MLTLAVAASALISGNQTHSPSIQWFRDARIGMFIHWGPVRQKGTEIGWSRGAQVPTEVYDNLYKTFEPIHFNADEWMRVAKQAGFRYVVPTAKHHDGFCLWPTASSPYNISQSPFRRDIMGELAKAARSNGIHMCSYYSILDWHSPDYGTGSPGGESIKSAPNMARHLQLVEAQVSELVDRYHLKMVWFDGQWEKPYTRNDSIAFNQYLRQKYPNLIVNNRIESEGLLTTDPHGDYLTPEQRVGSYDTDHPWETCMTLGDQWAYRPHDHYKSLDKVLEILIQTVTGDGNLLLNIGPTPEGDIAPEQLSLLNGMGNWLKHYGQSIYKTRGGPYINGKWGGTTRCAKTIFFHLLPSSGETVTLPPLPAKIVRVQCLQRDQNVKVNSDANSMTISRGSGTNSPITTVRVDIDRDALSLGTIR